MANYLSAIKTQFLLCGLDVACFNDARLKFYLKAIQRHAPLVVKLNKIIDIPMLSQIVEQCDFTYMGQVFKALYLLSFYSFCVFLTWCHMLSQNFHHLSIWQGEILFFNRIRLLLLLNGVKPCSPIIKLN